MIPHSAHPGVHAEFRGREPTRLNAWQTLLASSVAGPPGWPDLSEFNDPPFRSTPVDWGALGAAWRAGQIAGVMLRAGFGTVRADASFARNQQAARALGIPTIYYWFNYPAYNTPDAEASKFDATVGPLGPAEAQLGDFENDPGALGWPAGGAALAWGTAFLTAVQAPQNATLWYCSTSFVAPYDLASLAAAWGWLEAEYGVSSPNTLGLDPFGWQMTDAATVPGVNGPCDFNQLLRPPLAQWLTPGGATRPTPHGTEDLVAQQHNSDRVDILKIGIDGQVYHLWSPSGDLVNDVREEAWGGIGEAGTEPVAWWDQADTVLTGMVAGVGGQLYQRKVGIDGTVIQDWSEVPHAVELLLPAGPKGDPGPPGPAYDDTAVKAELARHDADLQAIKGSIQ